jgi:hypothetical protein
MSFGFEESVVIIDEAIKHANSQKVIMLAAASKKGGNGVTTWPARLPEVISIYTTDGLGNRCTFTPNPSSNADNFSILRHAVRSFWPPHLNQGAEVHKSRTCTATPIAAGIAALVLQYVKFVLSERAQIPQGDPEMFCKLRKTAGMSTVLRRMAPTKRDVYDYIIPWNFMSKSKPRGPSTVYDIVLGDLRDHTCEGMLGPGTFTRTGKLTMPDGDCDQLLRTLWWILRSDEGASCHTPKRAFARCTVCQRVTSGRAAWYSVLSNRKGMLQLDIVVCRFTRSSHTSRNINP